MVILNPHYEALLAEARALGGLEDIDRIQRKLRVPRDCAKAIFHSLRIERFARLFRSDDEPKAKP